MGRRSSGGLGAVLGVLLLLGLVIQVVKLLVVPLTILAVGAAVTVPIYLITRNRSSEGKKPLTATPPAPVVPEDDGIVSQDEVLRLLPRDIASAVTQGPPRKATLGDSTPETQDPHASQSTQSHQPTHSGQPAATEYRHGSCPIKHRSFEAAVRCRKG
jgi:hypothetical protein